MENKINVAELLKDCPSGMELDSSLFDDVHFDSIDEVCDIIKCYIQDSHHKIGISFNKYGCYSNISKSKCIIFPKGKTTWEGFVPPCQFKDGDIIKTITNNEYLFYSIYKGIEDKNVLTYIDYVPDENKIISISGVLCLTDEITEQRFATEEEKQKLFDAIKAKGYKWNAETKTLEELITPKKFDITTLKPFDKVLVRDSDKHIWCASIFSNTWKNKYYCVGMWHNQCIPYEGNEHLLGTTNDCDEYYKTW